VHGFVVYDLALEQDAHLAAAGMPVARPWLDMKFRVTAVFDFDRFERVYDARAQSAEKSFGGFLLFGHRNCLNASAQAMAQAVTRLSERAGPCSGILTRASAAACTYAGTPARSCPISKMSPG
jgi:hypothetical protein